MRKNKFWLCSFIVPACLPALLVLPACSVNVKKGANGEDKQVDINTLAGGIHVIQRCRTSDVGLAIYPGARLESQRCITETTKAPT